MKVIEFVEEVYLSKGAPVRGVIHVEDTLAVWCGTEVHIWDASDQDVYMPTDRPLNFVQDTAYLWKGVDDTKTCLDKVLLSL